MKRNDIDWSILRGAIIIFIFSLLLSGGLLAGSFYFKENMHKEYMKNNAMFKSISNRYFAVDEEEKQIKEYYPLFVELYNKGVIGREQRLNWIEVLREADEELGILGLNYDIRSQEAYRPGFQVDLGTYQLFRSIMNLNMQLLHEEDLFRLFELLDKRALGAYNVSSCNITVKGKKIIDDPGVANLNVECELIWHTIKLNNGKELVI
ncbi:MAG: hypothetical protein GKR93_04310 [Gammaproteobacteria bacterium]|nr:hypothetical protein [Gammaproteobacteria bacterium]